MSEQYQTIPIFDRALGKLQGLPDTIHTKPSTITTQVSFVGLAQTFTVQTYRQRDGQGDEKKSRDTVFLQAMSAEGTIRIVIPHEVVATLHRHDEQLTAMNRKRAAKRVAAARKEAGIEPGFMKARKNK